MFDPEAFDLLTLLSVWNHTCVFAPFWQYAGISKSAKTLNPFFFFLIDLQYTTEKVSRGYTKQDNQCRCLGHGRI